MKYPNKRFIEDIADLIKSLLNFCEYEIMNERDEISLFIKKEDLIYYFKHLFIQLGLPLSFMFLKFVFMESNTII